MVERFTDDMKRIIDIQLAALMKGLEERKIHITVTDAAKEQLVREGYDPAYGARPLKRTLRRRVLDALAMRILEGEFVDGDTVTVDALADGLRFEERPAVHDPQYPLVGVAPGWRRRAAVA